MPSILIPAIKYIIANFAGQWWVGFPIFRMTAAAGRWRIDWPRTNRAVAIQQGRIAFNGRTKLALPQSMQGDLALLAKAWQTILD